MEMQTDAKTYELIQIYYACIHRRKLHRYGGRQPCVCHQLLLQLSFTVRDLQEDRKYLMEMCAMDDQLPKKKFMYKFYH